MSLITCSFQSAARRTGAAWAMVLGMVLGLGACAPTPPEEPPATEPSGNSLWLELRSLQGDVVADARVSLISRPSPSSAPAGLASEPPLQPDAQGALLLESLQAGSQVVKVDAKGYASAYLSLNVAEGVHAGARLTLASMEPPITFDAQKGFGGRVGELFLDVPPDALVRLDGTLFKGTARMLVSALNLDKGGLVAAPGILEGIPFPGAVPVGLEGLGVMSISFESDEPASEGETGKVLSLAKPIGVSGRPPGTIRIGSQGAGPGVDTYKELSLPVKSQAARHVLEVPVWAFDEAQSRWKPLEQDGSPVMATLSDSELEPIAGQSSLKWQFFYKGSESLLTVGMPYWWHAPDANLSNLLQPPVEPWVESACMEVELMDGVGRRVAGREVKALGVKYVGLSRGVTDVAGRVRLEVMRGHEMDLDFGGGTLRVPGIDAAGDCRGHGAAPTVLPLPLTASVCTPGAWRACYSGPKDEASKGACQAGRLSCDVNGLAWSDTCVGEVLPQAESCDTAVDDNCDGTVNETCPTLCVEGEHPSCDYSGPPGTEGVGVCRAGGRACVANGTLLEACAGEVLPKTEVCGNGLDDDCDGYSHPDCAVWNPAAPLPEDRAFHTATLLPDGQVLVTGGNNGGVRLGSAELYGPVPHSMGSWLRLGDMTDIRSGHTATLLPDGKVLVSGGFNGGVTRLATAELFTSSAWTPTAPMNQAREQHTASLLDNGRVLVTGGLDSSGGRATAELYEPTTGQWSYTTNMMSTARYLHRATVLKNGKVLVTGGRSAGGNGAILATSELYDPTSDLWTPTSQPMSTARESHTATLLADGRVLVTGGFGSMGGALKTADLYDPTSDTWSSITPMNTTRESHTATRLADGQVLVTGGNNDTEALKTAELYNPKSNTWSVVSEMSVARAAHTATLLADGKVLIAGGDGVSTAEVYDPSP